MARQTREVCGREDRNSRSSAAASAQANAPPTIDNSIVSVTNCRISRASPGAERRAHRHLASAA